MTMRDTFSQFTAGKYFVLTGALISLIFSRAIDQTFYYRISYSFQAYVWVLGTIILPVAFLAISWPVVWYKLAKTDDITPEMKAFPKYKYAIMATFDTAFNLFSTFPIYHLGSDVSNVLSQAVLPINMIMSIIFLRTKFKQTHYIGAALCAYGMAVRLIPTFDDFNAQGGWILMLILAQIPAAASNVYKEIGLKGADLDVWYANAWISTFQLLFGVFTIWTVNVKAFMAPHDPIPWSKFGDYLGEAFTCFAGHPVHDSISGETHDYCTDLPYRTFLFFIVFNLTYNQLMLVVFKQGSSVLFVIASAVRLPLVDLFCMSKFLAGPAQQDFSLYDGFALFVLVLAIYIYYSHPEDRAPEGVVQDSEDVEGGKDDLGNLIVSPHVGRTSMYQHQRQGHDRNEPLLGDERTRSDHTSYRTRSASRG